MVLPGSEVFGVNLTLATAAVFAQATTASTGPAAARPIVVLGGVVAIPPIAPLVAVSVLVLVLVVLLFFPKAVNSLRSGNSAIFRIVSGLPITVTIDMFPVRLATAVHL